MTDIVIQNLRIDPAIGDGIAFIVEIRGVARRFFVSRETLGEVERTRLTNSSDMLASFERQSDKVRQAVLNTLKFGTSAGITSLKTAFFQASS